MGRDNRGSGAGKGCPLRQSNSPFSSSQRSWRSGSALTCNRRQSRHSPTPLTGPRSSGMGGRPSGHNTRCTPRPLPLPLKKSQAAKFPKEFPCGKKPTAQVEQSLKGEKASYVLYMSASSQTVPAAPLTNQHKCHMSCPWCTLFPYTLSAPHFLLPTPGQIRNSLDITKRRRKNTQIRSRRESPVHPPQT